MSSTVSLGSARGAEGLVGFGGAGEEQFGGAEGGERFGEGETLVKEETDGEEGGSRVADGYVEKIGAGGVEDQGRDRCCEWRRDALRGRLRCRFRRG